MLHWAGVACDRARGKRSGLEKRGECSQLAPLYRSGSSHAPFGSKDADPQAGRYAGDYPFWPAGARRRAVVGVASERLHQERWTPLCGPAMHVAIAHLATTRRCPLSNFSRMSARGAIPVAGIAATKA